MIYKQKLINNLKNKKMKPIIFCDVNHGSNLEKFMSKNLGALKKMGYNKFVLQSDQRTLKDAVKELKGIILMFDILGEGSKEIAALQEDTKAIIKVIELADKNGIKVLPTQGQNIESQVSKLSQKDDGVFAYVGTNFCHRFKDKHINEQALLVFSQEDFDNSEKLNGVGSTKAPLADGLLIEDFDSIDQMIGHLDSGSYEL